MHRETRETSGVGSNQPRPKLAVGLVPRPWTGGINLQLLERRVVQHCSDGLYPFGEVGLRFSAD